MSGRNAPRSKNGMLCFPDGVLNELVLTLAFAQAAVPAVVER